MRSQKKREIQAMFPREIPYHCFKEFTALDADRFVMLKNLLDDVRLCYTVCYISGNRHFFVYPDNLVPVNAAFNVIGCPPALIFQKALAKAHVTTVLAAHYDRAADSPGANDNSAAVFELIKAALALKKENIGNWLIFFTDKEELKFGDSLLDQGSYALAKALRDAGLDKAQVFIFDCCGVGDTLVISTAVDHLLRNDEGFRISRSRHLIAQMRERALAAARNIRMEKVLLVPTPFSDDAGFFRAGLAAQTITVLPSHEAAGLASFLRVNPDVASALVSKQELSASGFLPPTWALLNTAEDTIDTLTPRFFQNIVAFAYALVTGRRDNKRSDVWDL
ncbi:MAG: M28 family peptidase [Treponema sp.]|nr:M28 family peptidase [Treponema sp.]